MPVDAVVNIVISGLLTGLVYGLMALGLSVIYGVVLTTARALGEFGAVAIVSGNIAGRTQTLPLYVQAQYENSGSGTGAYAGAVVLAALAILTLVAMTMIRPREETHGDRST